MAIAALLAGGAAGAAYSCYEGSAALTGRVNTGPLTAPTLGGDSGYGLLPSGHHHHHRHHHHHCHLGGAGQVSGIPRPAASPAARLTACPAPAASRHLASGGYAGTLVLSGTGTRLMSWNQTWRRCLEQPFRVADGTVGTDLSGNATLTVNGQGSCAALVSLDCYGLCEGDGDRGEETFGGAARA
jgi:hypothetical protein